MLPGRRFDQTQLTIPANTYARIVANNTDEGVAHNFAVYRSEEDAESGAPPLARTEICSGPCKQLLDLYLAPGAYFYRSDVQVDQMTGILTAQ